MVYTIPITYHIDKRILSDGTDTYNLVIDTRGDNNIVTLKFTIDGTVPEGYEGRVEFDIPVKPDGTTGVAKKPYIDLDENDEATIPNSILKWALRRSLPIQLVYENKDTKQRFCSFNMLTYTVTDAIRAMH